MKDEDAYQQSLLIEKVKQSHNIAFLDLDHTMTGNIAAATEVRAILEHLGFGIVYVTARTEEAVISKQIQQLSKNFHRPLPKLRIDKNGIRRVSDPSESEPHALLNPDALISSSGTAIYILNKGRFIKDVDFERKLALKPPEWRNHVLPIVQELIELSGESMLAPIEYKENYEQGLTDVYPLPFRIKVIFVNVRAKKRFLRMLKAKQKDPSLQLKNICITDDSTPSIGRYFIYITPKIGNKVLAIDHMVSHIIKQEGIMSTHLKLLFAGDSLPDLRMGFYAAKHLQSDFILVGGSRLMISTKGEFYLPREFAGISLVPIQKQLQKETRGMYFYSHKRKNKQAKRTIFIGDTIFPKTRGPETILEYLKTMMMDKSNKYCFKGNVGI